MEERLQWGRSLAGKLTLERLTSTTNLLLPIRTSIEFSHASIDYVLDSLILDTDNYVLQRQCLFPRTYFHNAELI